MKKKIFLASLAAIGIFALSACSSKSQSLDDDLVTLKGGSITIGDYYDQIKASQSQQLQSMVVYKVFENAYGDKVTDKELQKSYDEMAKGYDDFDAVLKQNNMTEKDVKDNIRQSLAFEKGLEENMDLTDDELKTAWESFHPEVEAQLIQVADEDTAKELKTQLDKGEDFTKLAEDKSTATGDAEKGKKFKFDSDSTTVANEVKTAAFALKDGEVSDVVSATSTTDYTTSYFLVKMVKTSEKGDDMSKYEKEVKAAATQTKKQDQTFQSEVIKKELKAANVKIKDDTFSDLLAGFLTEDSSTADTGTASSSTKESSSEDSSAAESSSTAESTSASE